MSSLVPCFQLLAPYFSMAQKDAQLKDRRMI
jgi:hypothetical protein